MGNRIIKESICTSETIDQLSWFEEVLFYRLIVNCDDYGRFDGRPQIIRSRLFPLKNLTDKTVTDAINKLTTAGLIMPYTYDGKSILQLVTWDKHQSVRNKKSKYASIDGKDTTTASENVQMITFEYNCNQMKTDAPRARGIQSNPIQSESESENESILLPGAEEPAPDCKQPEPVFKLPLNDKTDFLIYEKDIKRYEELYPAVDIMQDLRNMLGWLDAKPIRRKTRNGIKAFITTWLSKTQNQGGTKGYDGWSNSVSQNGTDTDSVNASGIIIN